MEIAPRLNEIIEIVDLGDTVEETKQYSPSTTAPDSVFVFGARD